VYRAEQLALKKRIAIKLLHRDLQVADEALQRFQREGIAAGQVSHPNVIQIFDFDRTPDGLFFLAMEFVDGQNLKLWLAQRGPLPPEEAIELTRQLLSTLVEAHSHGIVHRDLKPENVMIVENAAGERSLKVLDFGLSKLVGRPLSAHETSQQKAIARIGGRVAIAVSLRPAQPQSQEAERTWFGAGETCGAGLLVLAPSLTQGDPEEASSIYHLALTVPDPERPNAFEFVLTAEPLQPGASVEAWEPLAGRIERSRDAGPDSWTVVHASVASGNEPAQLSPQAAAPQNPAEAAQPAAGEPAPESAVTE